MEVERGVKEHRFNLDAFILEIYDASLSRKWARVLEQCMSLFAANTAFLLLYDAVNQQFISLKRKSTTVLPESALQYYREQFHRDPLYIKSQYMEEGSILNTYDGAYLNLAEHPEYGERVLSPLNAEKTKVALVLKDGQYEAFFGVCRSNNGPDFTSLDDVYFNKIVPHLVRASRYFRDQESYKLNRCIAQGVYDNQPAPFLVCNRQLKILASNVSAQRYLRASDYCHNSNGHLSVSPARYLYQLWSAMDNCKLENPGYKEKERTLIIDEGGVTMTVLKVAFLNTVPHPHGTEVCFIISFAVKNQPDWKALSVTFSLTKREQLIAKLLYKEVTYQDIATTLDIDDDTVTVLVRSLYVKIGALHRRDFLELMADFPIQSY
ncbi:LuxR C-terminal-related transcriptional regulator [Alteromonas sp. C1M14]|uniref:helix-turn-helix transcriptional regulator n=1 Tax=Alteromonas sp. C1M14 TaxID=2841567 RepID=UPI001C089EC6|nr:LuxR C-terminal-related transcriptional regulator [Alteromonas sp. C1M14]MBU2980072.1 LuxR C-terminal-related transcriptional regulator [Alteromonas sp. C1M14]